MDSDCLNDPQRCLIALLESVVIFSDAGGTPLHSGHMAITILTCFGVLLGGGSNSAEKSAARAQLEKCGGTVLGRMLY